MASLFLAAAGGPSASSAQAVKGAPPIIGGIRQPFNEDGCGCTMLLRGRRRGADEVELRTVFRSDDPRERAQMNIDGRDVMLRLVRRWERVSGALKVGQRSVEEYEGGGARVKVSSTITKVCPPDEPTCEILSKSAVIAVTKGGRTRTVRAAGECGC